MLWGISTAAGDVLLSKFSHQPIRGEAGLEQSGEGPARAGSGGNYCRGCLLTLLLYLAKRTAWPFARLAEVIAAALILCGGSRWQCRDHLAAIELHCSDGNALTAPSD
jgi:hypothetical protein